jgi:iron complex transport system substrate-binding protein
MRIASLLPSATEILYALDLGDSVAGVTFECDYPPEARQKPILVDTVLAHNLSSSEIDRDVTEYAAHGDSIYRIHRGLLQSIGVDLVVTQELCDVCASAPLI